MKNRIVGGLLALGLVSVAASAVELKMKYEPGQTRTMAVELGVDAKLEVRGDVPIQGTGKGTIGSEMSLKVLSVDGDGVATIQQSVDDVRIDVAANAETPDGPKAWNLELTPKGGTFTGDGQTNPIPADSLKDIQEQSWTVKMNDRGAPVGMELETGDLTQQEAEQARQMSESIGNLMGKSALLPEGEVEPGQSWEHVLSVGEITKDLVKDNPMLSVVSEMGIPDLKTTYKLDELSTEGDNEIGSISSKTDFVWTEGNIPLGIVNITVNRLAIESNTLSTMNVSEGYISRQTSDSVLSFDLTINSVFGPEGPATYEADGSLTINSNVRYD